MPFYRFHVCDPVNRIDGPGHDGAALADDIDATLFAAGVIQRLVQHQPSVPLDWTIEIMRDSEKVGSLPFEQGCRVMLRPEWTLDQPCQPLEGWR